MNFFNKFSMVKKPNLSYILKLVEGDNYVCNQEICKCRQKAATIFFFSNFFVLITGVGGGLVREVSSSYIIIYMYNNNK